MSLVWKAVINEVVQMRNIIEHDEFYELVNKYLINKPAVLAYSSAAEYRELAYCEYIEKIEVYVEDFLPELNELKFKQIKVDSFDGIDYAEDGKGIKCCSSEQVIYDLLQRDYEKNVRGEYSIAEETIQAIEVYSIYNKSSFSKLKFSNDEIKKLFEEYLKILQERDNYD